MASRSDAGALSEREQRERDKRPTSPQHGHHSESSLSSYLHFRSHSRSGSNPTYSSGQAAPASGATSPIPPPPRSSSHGTSASGSQSQLMSSSISTEATPTPSASALRRALAGGTGGGGNTSDSASTISMGSGAGNKFTSLLHTLQPGARMGLGQRGEKEREREASLSVPRSVSRAESALGVSPAPSPMMGHSKMIPSNASIRAPYGGSGQWSSTSTLLPPAPAHPPPAIPTSGSTSTPPTAIGAASSMTLPLSSTEKDNPWGALHVHVLPLFNRDPLRIPIEDLNSLVRRHVISVISRNPNKNKAVEKLEADVEELILGGMVTLNSKLAGGGVDEEKLTGRIVELWGFFWDQVLPYVEGVFLPLQTDPYLLMRAPKTVRAPSPSHSDLTAPSILMGTIGNSSLGMSLGSTSTLASGSGYINGGVNSTGGPSIDVRKIALRAFRDSVVFPVASKLQKALSSPTREKESDMQEYQKARLEQMLLVLSSISTHRVSLTSNTLNAQLSTPSEKAVTTLLKLALYPPGTHAPTAPPGPRLPSFISGGAPRDRRGRVARRSGVSVTTGSGMDGRMDGGYGGTLGVVDGEDREREGRELLASLRSPNPDLGDAEAHDLVGNERLREDDEDTDREEEPGGTVMPADGIGSLGTGPGGWGSKAGDVPNGKRSAVYEDPDLQNPMGAFEDEGYTSPGRGGGVVGGRRPSRVDTESEVERRMRI